MSDAVAPKIYRSLLPDVPVVSHSIFTLLFDTPPSPSSSSSNEAPAYIDAATSATLSRGDLRWLSLKLASGLRNRLNIGLAPRRQLNRGDMVMIASQNSLSWPVVLFGCIAGGLKMTFAPCSSTPRELAVQFLDSKPRILIVSEALVPVAKKMFDLVGIPETEARARLWVMDLDFGQLRRTLGTSATTTQLVNRSTTGADKDIDAGLDMHLGTDTDGRVIGTVEIHSCAGSDVNCSGISRTTFPPHVSRDKNGGRLRARRLQDLIGDEIMDMEDVERFDGEDAKETVFVCYSSGTTGKPKGVETSHTNVCTVLKTTQAVWSGCESPHDVYISVIPFYHIFGLTMLLHYPLMRGRPLVMMNQGFEPVKFCEAVERYRVTTLCCVPPIILALANDPRLDSYDLSSLTNITSGAAPLSVALASKFLERLENRGAKAILIQGCGSTETTCPAQIVAPIDAVRKFGSVGQLVPNVEARLVRDDGGRVIDVLAGEEGEMWVRGPTICKGYLSSLEANKATFTSDGWYKTGDILRRDRDGYFYIVDRKKEMLKYKGHQIAPAELEAIMMENYEVADVGVVGLKDLYSGDELPRAYVSPSDRSILRSQSSRLAFERRVDVWLRGQVSPIKYLRGGVRTLAEVPKSGTGKILRKELREMAEREARRTSIEDGALLRARL